jgi:hypothetical protein
MLYKGQGSGSTSDLDIARPGDFCVIAPFDYSCTVWITDRTVSLTTVHYFDYHTALFGLLQKDCGFRCKWSTDSGVKAVHGSGGCGPEFRWEAVQFLGVTGTVDHTYRNDGPHGTERWTRSPESDSEGELAQVPKISNASSNLRPRGMASSSRGRSRPL